MKPKPGHLHNSKLMQSHRVNTIGVQKHDLIEVLERFEEPTHGGQRAIQRIFARWPFPNHSIGAKIIHPGGNEVDLKLACRNISRGGIALLHSAYMHPGSRLAVMLPNRRSETKRIEGTIARCIHREGIIHEIGVTFDDEIILRDYIMPDLFSGWVSYEQVDPSELGGSVLHVEPSPMDQKIVGHFLRDTTVRVRPAASGEQALLSAQSGCDLIICEHKLEDISGPKLVRLLRAKGIRTPVIMVSSKLDEMTKTEIRFSGANAHLRKPFDQHKLLLMVAEFLLGAPADDQQEATEQSGSPAELSVAFGAKLRQYAEELEKMVRENRAIDAYVVCVQIKAAAPALGFKAIGDRAEWLSTRLSRGTPFDELREHIHELTAACRNLRGAA